MATAEMLRETSSKHYAEQALKNATETGWLEQFHKNRRHPDTIVGTVLSIEDADRLWLDPKPSMLHDMGMTFWSNSYKKVVFMTDDYTYGADVLRPNNWQVMSHRYRGTAHQVFDSFREYLAWYFEGHRVVESEQELLDFLNEGF